MRVYSLVYFLALIPENLGVLDLVPKGEEFNIRDKPSLICDRQQFESGINTKRAKMAQEILGILFMILIFLV